ncbi:hypothetical protein [Arthrobacter sp. MA-N2]|uniref:hypothetical protein n=1 Tax=Arthrobacter sp. MA-N2 TaxID=1101188 RepID=UPI0004827E5B|nr:hypothetical protein [Arthrobacter sp. MA-N2]
MSDLSSLLAPIRAREAAATDHPGHATVEQSQADVPRLLGALDKVIALHEPVDALMNPGRHERVVKVCTGCGTDDGNWQRWPCPTVTAVTAALGEGK